MVEEWIVFHASICVLFFLQINCTTWFACAGSYQRRQRISLFNPIHCHHYYVPIHPLLSSDTASLCCLEMSHDSSGKVSGPWHDFLFPLCCVTVAVDYRSSPAVDGPMSLASVLSVMLLISVVLCSILTCSPRTCTVFPELLAYPQRVFFLICYCFKIFEINLTHSNCFNV